MVRTESLRIQSARHRVDHGTISVRSCANSGHYKPLFACVDRTFCQSDRRRDGAEIFFLDGGRAISVLIWGLLLIASMIVNAKEELLFRASPRTMMKLSYLTQCAFRRFWI